RRKSAPPHSGAGQGKRGSRRGTFAKEHAGQVRAAGPSSQRLVGAGLAELPFCDVAASCRCPSRSVSPARRPLLDRRSDMTALDDAHLAMTASGDAAADAARLRYFAALADAELVVMLEDLAE